MRLTPNTPAALLAAWAPLASGSGHSAPVRTSSGALWREPLDS